MKQKILQIIPVLIVLLSPFTVAHAQEYYLEGKVVGIQYRWASTCSVAINDPNNDYYSDRLQPTNWNACTLAAMALFTGTPVEATAKVVPRGLNEYIKITLKK